LSVKIILLKASTWSTFSKENFIKGQEGDQSNTLTSKDIKEISEFIEVISSNEKDKEGELIKAKKGRTLVGEITTQLEKIPRKEKQATENSAELEQ